MFDEIDVSVIISVYNIKQYISKCIESVLNQSCSNIEILLVDDDSTDGSLDICRKYQNKDSRIRLVKHKENYGLVRTRKTGLKEAKGKYVVFVDGDDYVESDLCEKMMAYIDDTGCDFVHANYYIDKAENSNGIKDVSLYEMVQEEKEDYIAENILYAAFGCWDGVNIMTPSIWSKIFRREFIFANYNTLPDSQSYGEDLICLCACILNCKSFMVVPDAYYHYNVRDLSMSHRFGYKNIVRNSQMYISIKNKIERYNSRKLNEALEFYFKNTVFQNLKHIETETIHINRFAYNSIEELFDKKVIIYGAGKVGADYFDQLNRYSRIKIVGWIDRNTKIKKDYFLIEGIENIIQKDFDLILIAINNKKTAMSIINELTSLGLDKRKMVWDPPLDIVKM